MLKTLRQFIREEITWNYWMRRPHNGMLRPRDIGDNIETQRQDTFRPVAVDFEQKIRGLEHAIRTGSSVHDIENTIVAAGIDAYEIVTDVTEFERAVEEKDVAEVKRQLLSGLKSWASQVIHNTEDDDYNYSTLLGFLDRTE